MMLRELSLRVAGAAALLFAAVGPAYAAGASPQPSAGTPSAQAGNNSAAASTEAASKPEEHKICRMVNGSEARLGAKKVCMTAKQWKEADY
jgi:hypothetical protein